MTEEKPSEKPVEQKKLFLFGVPEVLYAPHRAFKDIVPNPKIQGPILLMILFLITYTVFGNVAFSKIYDESTVPDLSQQLDLWTENATLWTSNALVSLSNDAVNGSGSYFGNNSIRFSLDNSAQVYMQINFSESINCTGPEGYKNVSFRTKIVQPEGVDVANASIILFSDQVGQFQYDLTSQVLPTNNTQWYNFTLGVGPQAGWVASSLNADWSNITGLQFGFNWNQNANITVLVDGLFFRGLFHSISSDATTLAYSFATSAFMRFVVTWVILGGILYVVSRGLGGKSHWKIMLLLTGFCLAPLFVGNIITTAAYTTLPTVYRPVELFAGVPGEYDAAYASLVEKTSAVTMVDQYTQVAMLIWIVLLCTFAVNAATGMSKLKSFLVAMSSYLLSMIITEVILSLFAAF
jgi:hypothetical protein